MNSDTAKNALTHDDAIKRAEAILNVSYKLFLDLHLGKETYQGKTTIIFETNTVNDITIDFTGSEITNLILNSISIEKPDWDGHKINLPKNLMQTHNIVEIIYVNNYDHTGDGFHQFIDPEDNEEYLYSNFEPYSAHKLFPCFDQPDIKATYKLEVSAPNKWKIVHNSSIDNTSSLPDQRLHHEFLKTEKFSTYLFALICGPYEEFREKHNDIDLGFYCRQSLTKYLDTDELFQITKEGLDFFVDFFDYPYPFGKYDQIFVPEYNAGAMENVAAITFNEAFIFRDPPTENQRSQRAEVILHEMAHMWFGDLVTMKWWNDLWLNESFATYMAYLAMVNATRFTNAWQSFNSGMKNWAYRQDQLVTTHPIAGTVEDTDQTLLNFDGITYGKGAATLKQLAATMGIEGFRSGIQLYFKKYEYGNATLHQFLDALQEGLLLHGEKRDLHEWAYKWLETASVNTIKIDWDSASNQITSMAIEQSASDDHPTLRPHFLEIALVETKNNNFHVKSIPINFDTSIAKVEDAKGLAKPDFIFPNYNDHGFIKVSLDDHSLNFAKSHLEVINDPLLRQLTWQSLWNMVRDQSLPSIEYLQLGSTKLPLETDFELVQSVLATMNATLSRYVPNEQKTAIASHLFDESYKLLNSDLSDNLRIIWTRALISFAMNTTNIQLCLNLADGIEKIENLNVDQDMRWNIAIKAIAYNFPNSAQRLEAEKLRDKSDRGERQFLRGLVSQDDLEIKHDAWQKFLDEGYGSLHLTRAAMSGFYWWQQENTLTNFNENFFSIIENIFENNENEFSRTFFDTLFPPWVDEKILIQARQLHAQLDDNSPLLNRLLLEAIDDLERAIQCQLFAESVSK
ncbi:MAG: aminopeptidase N [Chloroflexi bacterium]|nr:aminopeptidase N [Chloroflexota bacterium]